MAAKKVKHIILGVHITDRLKEAVEVQKLLTVFGRYIKTRLGLHEVDRAEGPSIARVGRRRQARQGPRPKAQRPRWRGSQGDELRASGAVAAAMYYPSPLEGEGGRRPGEGCLGQKRPLTPTPSPSAGRGENAMR